MNVFQQVVSNKNMKRGVLGLTIAAGLSLAAGTALADGPTTMAPPIDGASVPLSAGNAGVNASADSVFNWQEIPAGQPVALNRATFDQGGYQLYDTVGETIVVPFTNQNLYVMKFAESRTGKLYFENEGGFPVLYVPKGGSLENATVAGARWFPLGENFHPAEPVFLGIAPSYTDFVDLGWYPDTFYYGGYYGHTSFISGGLFLPTVGLFFSIGGHPYYGWNSYHDYYRGHPGFYHTAFYNRDFYHYAGNRYREFAPDRHFGGYSGGFNHGAGGGYSHGFGGDHAAVVRNGFGGQGGFGGRGGSGGVRTFRGAGSDGSHNYSVSHNSYTVNNYGGGQHFGGGQSSGGQSGSGRTFRGASNNGGGQSYSGGRSYGGGGQSYSSGHSSSSEHSSSSGFDGRSFGGHSFGGNSGGHSFGGGQQSHTGSNSGGGGSRGGDSGNRGGDSGSRGGGGRR